MEGNGWTVRVEAVDDIAPVKQRFQVPSQLQSCHTTIVDGYVIEGHVPSDAIERLLAERPDVIGLTVPGMPIGSPGMEVEGVANQPYDVLTFDANGQTEVFASYGS